MVKNALLLKLLPGLQWSEGYTRSTLSKDLFSGLAIAFMLIPQSMGYAMVAGLPAQWGLYACVIPPIIYALLGTSNKISIGPVALDSILIISGLSLIAEAETDRYLSLALTMTLMVGLIQAVLGMARFGFIANFLSYPVILGYTSAAALIIMASQFGTLLGYSLDTSNFFLVVYELVVNIDKWHVPTVIVGFGGLVFLIFSKKIYKGPPYALLLLIFGMAITGLFHLNGYGIAVVSDIPQGLSAFVMPNVALDDIKQLLPLALTVALMGYVGSMSICKTLEKPSDRIFARPNQELLAVGIANIVASFFKAFPVSASFSRSAAFREAGAQTQFSAVVSSVCIGLILLFFTPLFVSFPLPKALLAVIVIVSVYGLFKYQAMLILAKQSKKEFALSLLTFLVTLLVNVQAGLITGVVVSIVLLIYNTANPHMTELGAMKEGALFRNIHRFPEAEVRPDVLVFRFDAPLYFANKDFFIQHVNQWIKRRPEGQLRHVIFDAEAVNSVDSTALLMLQQLIINLESQGIKFYISNAIGPVRDEMRTSVLATFICEKTLFASIREALSFIDKGVVENPEAALQTGCPKGVL